MLRSSTFDFAAPELALEYHSWLALVWTAIVALALIVTLALAAKYERNPLSASMPHAAAVQAANLATFNGASRMDIEINEGQFCQCTNDKNN